MDKLREDDVLRACLSSALLSIMDIVPDDDSDNDNDLLYVVATQFDLPVFTLNHVALQRWLVELLPWAMVHSDLIVPLSLHEGRMLVLTPRPLDESETESISELTGYRIEQALCAKKELKAALSRVYCS